MHFFRVESHCRVRSFHQCFHHRDDLSAPFFLFPFIFSIYFVNHAEGFLKDSGVRVLFTLPRVFLCLLSGAKSLIVFDERMSKAPLEQQNKFGNSGFSCFGKEKRRIFCLVHPLSMSCEEVHPRFADVGANFEHKHLGMLSIQGSK